MGKKKKFIDKKRAATFLLLARDSSDLRSSEADCNHVFVRVDNNPFAIGGLDENGDSDSNFERFDNEDSILAEDFVGGTRPSCQSGGHSGSLPDHTRREILELGFPDDGYNYLDHFREIKQSGAGSEYYLNSKLNLDRVPLDVKAYDASMVWVKAENIHANEKRVMYGVAEKSVNVKVQKVVDPDVVALLDDSNSDLGSDVEDLEEDFVVRANFLEEKGDSSFETSCSLADGTKQHKADVFSSGSLNDNMHRARERYGELDEQFDMLELQKYGTDSDDNYDDASVGEEEKLMSQKPDNILKNHQIDGLELSNNYKTPADFLCGDDESNGLCGSAAEKYEDADEDECDVVALEESSDESEAQDRETVISTYSYLDNHLGRIGDSEFASKKKLGENISRTVKSKHNTKEKKLSKEKFKPSRKTDKPINRQLIHESKEEKKERKEEK